MERLAYRKKKTKVVRYCNERIKRRLFIGAMVLYFPVLWSKSVGIAVVQEVVKLDVVHRKKRRTRSNLEAKLIIWQ